MEQPVQLVQLVLRELEPLDLLVLQVLQDLPVPALEPQVPRDQQVRLVLGLLVLLEALGLRDQLEWLAQRVRVLGLLDPQDQLARLVIRARPAPQEQGLLAPRDLLGLLVLLVEDLLALLDLHLLLLDLRVRQVAQARLALLVPQVRLAHPAVAARHSG